MDKMKTIHNYYSNIPCVDKNCKFWGGEYQEEKVYPRGYARNWLGLGIWNNEEITSIWHGEHCKKDFELGKLRQSIYERADKASNDIYKENKYKRITMLVSKAHEAFDKIADEWRNMRCPFYEKGNSE